MFKDKSLLLLPIYEIKAKKVIVKIDHASIDCDMKLSRYFRCQGLINQFRIFLDGVFTEFVFDKLLAVVKHHDILP